MSEAQKVKAILLQALADVRRGDGDKSAAVDELAALIAGESSKPARKASKRAAAEG